MSGKKRKASAAAAPSARKGHEYWHLHNDPLKTFTRWVAFPTALVYLVVCALVFLTLHLMTSEINRIDGDRGGRAISAALGSFVQQLGEQVNDEATWTEAYINTYVNLNPAWLDSTWGTTARDDGHYDTAIVSDAKGQIIFGESLRGPMTGLVGDTFSGATELAAELGSAIEQLGDDAVAAHFTGTAGGGLSALAGAVIHGSQGQMTVPPEERRVLWLAKQIDGEMLSQIAYRFQIPVPRLDTERPPGPGDDTLAITDAAGQTVARLVWEPLRPGDAVFLHIAGIAAVALFVVGILTFAVVVAFRRTVQRRAEVEERDWVSARYDASTGLLNRFGLEETILRVIPRRRPELNVAVAYIELEGLKTVAGTYGQETVETLLDRLADLIDAAIDGQGQLARLGPDEFAICRTGDDAGIYVRRFARIVIDILAEAVLLDDLRLKLIASIGIGETAVTPKSVGEPIAMAAAAMQRARETGGHRIVEYDPVIEDDLRQRLSLQADIRRGLAAGEFDLEYQPIFDFLSQQMSGVEALLRWPRRAGGAMSPVEFIPAAEASGLIEELGLYALRRACEQMAPFPDLKLSVNVSTVQFRSPALASQIDAILAANAFPPDRLQLEITESFLLAQPGRAKQAIEDLRARGIAIALDDFGTGFSSVGYLRQFSFDRVKLDRSLVSEIDIDPVKLALVQSTMVFAFAMGLAVTAEGVERREEAAALVRLGCTEFQGYLFARPLNIDALSRLRGQPAELKMAG